MDHRYGGLTAAGTATSDVEAYNTKVGGNWATIAPMITGRHAGCFGTIGGNLYFAAVWRG